MRLRIRTTDKDSTRSGSRLIASDRQYDCITWFSSRLCCCCCCYHSYRYGIDSLWCVAAVDIVLLVLTWTDANVFRRSPGPSTGRPEVVPRRAAARAVAASNCSGRRRRENTDDFDESGGSVEGLPGTTDDVAGLWMSPSLLHRSLTLTVVIDIVWELNRSQMLCVNTARCDNKAFLQNTASLFALYENSTQLCSCYDGSPIIIVFNTTVNNVSQKKFPPFNSL